MPGLNPGVRICFYRRGGALALVAALVSGGVRANVDNPSRVQSHDERCGIRARSLGVLNPANLEF